MTHLRYVEGKKTLRTCIQQNVPREGEKVVLPDANQTQWLLYRVVQVTWMYTATTHVEVLLEEVAPVGVIQGA